MTWPLDTTPPRTWVRPLANIGYEVMISSDRIGERRAAYRINLDEANAIALRHHEKALDLIAAVEEVQGRKLDILMPELDLLEADDAKAS